MWREATPYYIYGGTVVRRCGGTEVRRCGGTGIPFAVGNSNDKTNLAPPHLRASDETPENTAKITEN